jgi:hypothetical protein
MSQWLPVTFLLPSCYLPVTFLLQFPSAGVRYGRAWHAAASVRCAVSKTAQRRIFFFIFNKKILNSTNREIHGSAPNQEILIPRRRRLPENLFDLVCVYSF